MIVEIAKDRSVAEEFKPPNRKVRQILTAATEMFLEQGYDPTSMDAVAQTANVSKATLYSHFSNKETLFAALVEAECKSIADRLRPSFLDLDGLEVTLRQIASQFTDLFLDPRGLAMHRLIFAEAARFPKISGIFIKWGPHLVRRQIADLLVEATKNGLIDVPDPHLGAMHFLSLVVGDLPMECQLGIAQRSAADIQRQVDSGMALFLKGYAMQPEATSSRRRPPSSS